MIPDRDDTGLLNHQDRAADRDHRSVQHARRNGKRLSGTEINALSAVELDSEQPVQDEEELVLLVVLVPVELALHHAEPYENVAHLDQRLVEPRRVDSVDQRLHIHRLQGGKQGLVVDVIVLLSHDSYLSPVLDGLA